MEEAPGPVVVGVVVLARLLVGLRRVCEPGTRGIGHAPARQDPPILSLKSGDGFNWMVRLLVERPERRRPERRRTKCRKEIIDLA